MRIVIDIPEETYHEINSCGLFLSPRDKEALVVAIGNGTVLSKRCGRLIDADKLGKETYTMTEWNGDVHQIIYKASLDDAPTVIAADTEVEKCQ